MRRSSVFASVSAGALLLAGCVAPSQPEPRPAPPVAAPTPHATPAPPPAPTSADWRDWRLTPGNWSYAAFGAAGSSATFAGAGQSFIFKIGCDPSRRVVTLSRPGPLPAQAFTIRTTSTARTLSTVAMAHADAWPPETRDARLPANDPLLDAIGYSRGRFVVETTGAPALVIPAWSEIQRVIEDCRG